MSGHPKGRSPWAIEQIREFAEPAELSISERAVAVIEGECKAREFLTRLHAYQAEPNELGLILARLQGSALDGFCKAIAKALRGGVR